MFEKYNHNLDLHFVVYPNKMRLVTAKFPFLQKLTHLTKVRYASGNVFFYHIFLSLDGAMKSQESPQHSLWKKIILRTAKK